MMIAAMFLLVLPFAIAGFWKKRPVIVLILATLLAYLVLIVSSLLQTFQAMMIYGTADPQLMAEGIARSLASSTLAIFVVFPALALFQFAMRRHRQAKTKRESALADFE